MLRCRMRWRTGSLSVALMLSSAVCLGEVREPDADVGRTFAPIEPMDPWTTVPDPGLTGPPKEPGARALGTVQSTALTPGELPRDDSFRVEETVDPWRGPRIAARQPVDFTPSALHEIVEPWPRSASARTAIPSFTAEPLTLIVNPWPSGGH